MRRCPSILAGVLLVLAVSGGLVQGNQVAQNSAPANPAKPAFAIDGDAAVITVRIKPDRTADFEAVIQKLRDSLLRSRKPSRMAQAAGWRVFKSTEAVQGQATYVMLVTPAIRGEEYDLTRLIAEEFPSEVQVLAERYKAAFADRSVLTLEALSIQGLGRRPAGGSPGLAPGPEQAASSPPVQSFESGAAVITILIKPDHVADFESVLRFLGRSLQESNNPVRKQQAEGWAVFKATSLVNGSATYVMMLDPVVRGQEYDLTRLIAEVFPIEIRELFEKYRNAFVGMAVVRLMPVMTLAP